MHRTRSCIRSKWIQGKTGRRRWVNTLKTNFQANFFSLCAVLCVCESVCPLRRASSFSRDFDSRFLGRKIVSDSRRQRRRPQKRNVRPGQNLRKSALLCKLNELWITHKKSKENSRPTCDIFPCEILQTYGITRGPAKVGFWTQNRCFQIHRTLGVI